MTSVSNIAELQRRIANAEKARDAFHATGMTEKYLENYSTIEALELQVDKLRTAIRIGAVSTASPSPSHLPESAPEDRERQMVALSIGFDGRQYHYESYRYDALDDALNYARLQRPTPAGHANEELVSRLAGLGLPSEYQRTLMVQLGITVHDGTYRYGEYRYDQVADAIAYAQLAKNIIKRNS